ncbi:MAG: hypothetical protein AAF349_23130 [Cyanobacteria bacterium P01_A01_bin.68]
MGRGGDGEMEIWGEGERGRQGDKETRRQGDRENKLGVRNEELRNWESKYLAP